jgi:hypothetical protein
MLALLKHLSRFPLPTEVSTTYWIPRIPYSSLLSIGITNINRFLLPTELTLYSLAKEQKVPLASKSFGITRHP